jgi:hypothetical protein
LAESIRVRADGSDVADRVQEHQEALRAKITARDGFLFRGFARDAATVVVSKQEQD